MTPLALQAFNATPEAWVEERGGTLVSETEDASCGKEGEEGGSEVLWNYFRE